MKKILFFLTQLLFLLTIQLVLAQAPKKIIVENSDFADVNQTEIPDALLLIGNVRVNHDGVVMTCNKAYYFQKENYIKAFGNVQMVQGDTLFLNSKYAEYNGNVKKAYASGDAVMSSPDATLVTEIINFDRNIQEVFYDTPGTITNKDKKITLESKGYGKETIQELNLKAGASYIQLPIQANKSGRINLLLSENKKKFVQYAHIKISRRRQ